MSSSLPASTITEDLNVHTDALLKRFRTDFRELQSRGLIAGDYITRDDVVELARTHCPDCPSLTGEQLEIVMDEVNQSAIHDRDQRQIDVLDAIWRTQV